MARSDPTSRRRRTVSISATLGTDLTGKVAFVAGVADSTGYGWAIAKVRNQPAAFLLLWRFDQRTLVGVG